ncbi:MAG TPA: hypothetical protein VEZ19_03430 [Rubrobacter sp.]|nr:hypothetical protein [Rubrobacter sp.]
MPVLLFVVFVALVVLGISAFGYSLSLLKEPPISRRCRVPHEMHHRRMIRRRRVRCRYEG